MKYLALLLLIAVAVAQGGPVLSETANLRLLNSYQGLVIINQSLEAANAAEAAAKTSAQQYQTQLQKAVNEFQTLEAKEAKAGGFPKGTTFTIDMVTGAVTPVTPKPDDKEKK